MKKILALLLSLASMQATVAPMSRDNVTSNPINYSHLNDPDDHKEVCCTYSQERGNQLGEAGYEGTYSGMCCCMPSSTNYTCGYFSCFVWCGYGSCFCNSNALKLWFVCCYCCFIPCPAPCRDQEENVVQFHRLISDRKLNKQRRMKYIMTCIDRMHDINQDYLKHSGSRYEYYWPPPLHKCIDTHDEEVAQLLIKKGADVNKKSSKNHHWKFCEKDGETLKGWSGEYTPLHVAIFKGANNCTKLLIFAGADPDIACEDNKTPRWLANIFESSHIIDQAEHERSQSIQDMLITNMTKALCRIVDSYLTGREEEEGKETKSFS